MRCNYFRLNKCLTCFNVFLKETKLKTFANMSQSPINYNVDHKCIFCSIIAKKTRAEIIYEDPKYVVFSDIKPASRYHYLITPKIHIKDAKSLNKEDIELIKEMRTVASQLIDKQNLNAEDTRLGFHWPPFCSIYHLHLHLIAPVSEMSFFGRLIFKPSFWFRTLEDVIKMLEMK